MNAPNRAKPSRGYWRQVWRIYRRSPSGVIGLFLAVFLIAVGIAAPLLANNVPILCRYEGEIHAPALVEFLWNVPGMKLVWDKSAPFDQATFDFERSFDPERGDWAVMPPVPYHPNGTSPQILQGPGEGHLLGTDEVGRDLMSRMIYGARVSMLVGFVAVGISTLIGLLLGSLAGYFGSWVDMIISRIIEIVMCFPVFFLVLSIIVWLEPSIWNVMIVLGMTRWTGIARYVRGEFIRLRDMEFSLAASALGARPGRIILRHILPNALAPVFVSVTFGIASAILVESGLSWLGFGVQPPSASWGSILKSGYDNILTTTHMIFPPCIAIFVAVLSYNLVGDAFRDAIDPRVMER